MKKIFIYGAGGHGLVVAEIAALVGYEKIIFIDDGDNSHLGFDVIKYENSVPMALGIGSNTARNSSYYKALEFGFQVKTLIHPTAIISPSTSIEMGSVVMAGVIMNAKAKVGKGVILNTGAIIEHENSIGDFAHISPGVALAGNVYVGEHTHVGIGSCVKEGVSIGAYSIVGAGSVVVKNIQDHELGFGNPYIKIRSLK